jgi:nucleotide-binding universal stress UspA family protein
VADAPEATLADVRSLAAVRGRIADLVVLGQPIAADLSQVDDLVFEGTLFGAGAPCLMLPRWERPRVWGRRVLIAWKSSPEAARAVREAMPLLQRADAVGVYHFAEAPEETSDVDALVQHLGRHGVRIDQAVREGGAGAAGEAILAAAGGFGADLVVMGGYGHTRLHETIFGGATRTLARFSQTALFLSH